MSLADSLKKTRQKALMTQEDFAQTLNVSVATINRWEKGKAKPHLTALKAIKNFCIENNLPFEEVEKAWFDENPEEEK